MFKTILTSLILFFLNQIVYTQNCGLVVPPNPLTAQGLATPYILTSLDQANPCSMLNPNTAVFVEATILDIVTGNLFIYHPLVVDNLNQVAVPPVVPTLSSFTTVGIFVGSNGQQTTLIPSTITNGTGIQNSLIQGNCVNGVQGSNFGQVAFCNTQQFYSVANFFVKSGLIKLPPIGTTIKGDTCPTVRSFAIVDQDQSDNVLTQYIITTDLKVAQNTAANRKLLNVLAIQENGSDNALLDKFIYPVLQCQSFMVPDLTDNNNMVSSQGLNELFATQLGTVYTNIAFVPSGDPMVLVNGIPNLQKLNLFRQSVDQPTVMQLDPNDNMLYCNNLAQIFGSFMALHNFELTIGRSPNLAVGNNLFNFLANRFVMTWTNLNCQQLTGKPSPITVVLDGNGVAIGNNAIQTFGVTPAPPTVAPVVMTVSVLQPILIILGVLLFLSITINISLPIYYTKKKDKFVFDKEPSSIRLEAKKESSIKIEKTKELDDEMIRTTEIV